MTVAVIGSRCIKNMDIGVYLPNNTAEIISGGAKGIDALVEKYADKNSIPKRIIKPEYSRYKKAAPLKRNEDIVNISDLVIAIWDGKSRGTKYVIDYAKKVGKPIEVYIILQDKKDMLNG